MVPQNTREIVGSSSIRQRYITTRLWRHLCSKRSETRQKYFLFTLAIARMSDEPSHLREVGGNLHRVYPSFHAPDIRNEENLAMRRRAEVDTLKCTFSPLSTTLETRGVHDAQADTTHQSYREGLRRTIDKEHLEVQFGTSESTNSLTSKGRS